KPGGHINVSLFLSDVYYETPIFGGMGYFVGTARKSYPNYALLAIYPEAIPANAKYADYLDGQYKLNIKFNNSHELLFTYFGARDILNYTKSVDELSSEESGGFLDGIGDGANGGSNTNTSGRPPVGLDRGFHTQGVRYTYTYEGMLKNDMYAQVSRFKEDFELDFRSPFTGETIFGYEVLDSRREFQYRDELSIGIIDDHLIANVGAEINKVRWELSLRNFSPQENINPNTPSFVETINDLVESNRTFRSLYDGDRTYYDLHAYYSELEIEFWRFRLTPGVRGEWYSLSHSTGVGPRAGMEFSIPESGTTLLAGAGRHFNVPPGLNYVSIEAGNPGLEMEAADHLAAGVDQELGDEWLIKLEVFRNIFRNLVVEDTYIVAPFSPRTNLREWATKPYDVASDPLENRPLNFSNDGTGWSEGFEVYIKKSRAPGRSGFFGWISYSNSLTKRNNHQPRLTDDQDSALRARNQGRSALIYREFDRNFIIYYDSNELEYYYDNDREELYDLDRTHQISLVINYKFNPEWQVGLRWQYATNVPYTPITGTQDLNLPILGRPTFIPEYSDFYNSERLGPVHQLDIRVDRFVNYGWGYANFYMELINFYARRNPESTSFDFLYPYVRGTNPSVNYESTYIQTPVGGGRILLLPLINFGMEIQF
ncbi:MAG: TonB-dependent receptor, partial [Leptospiraceae bacterium]|nr:TonB-dependent receptor [Leptospiraceae bacterium]